MSDLSYTEKLLDGDDVEWVSVSELFHLKNGYTPSKSKKEFWEDGTIPWFRMDDIRQNGRMLDNSLQKITEIAVKGGKIFPANSIIIATSATIGEHALITVPFLANQRFTILSLKEKYTEKLNNKYLYYYGFFLADWCKKNITMSSFASVDMNGFRKLEIPVPCPKDSKKSLAVQAEIVRILDAFTSLTADLTAALATELTDRKKQYNHYRDELLTFDEGEVVYKPLGDIAEYPKTRISHEQLDETNHVGVDNLLQNRAGKVESRHVPTSGNLTEYLEGDILIGNIRPYLKKILHADCVGGANGDVLVVHITDETVNSRYLYQVLADDKFFEYNMQHAKGAKMPRGNKLKIMEYSVPIPKSENEQIRIASILDKFDVLTNSISESLPHEIELRQKQYEYYRDLLLSFPKPDIITIPKSSAIRQSILKYLAKSSEPVKLARITESVGKNFKLSKREMENTMPKETKRFATRVMMTVNEMKKSGFLRSASYGHVEITTKGRGELERPTAIAKILNKRRGSGRPKKQFGTSITRRKRGRPKKMQTVKQPSVTPIKQDDKMIQRTTDIVISYVEKNSVNPKQIPGIIESVYKALTELGSTSASRKTIGKMTKTLIRHLPAVERY